MFKKTFLKKISLICILAMLSSFSVFLPNEIISPLVTTVEAAVTTSVLDSCDFAEGWTTTDPNNTLSLDPNDKQEGSSSLKCVGNGAVQFQKVFSTPVNSGVTKENGYLQFWYYVSDPNKLSDDNRVEISSTGTYEDFYGWSLPTNLSVGWNFVNLKISDAVLYSETPPAVDPNLSAINYFRIFNYVSGSITTKIDDIRFTAEGAVLDNCDSTTGWTTDPNNTQSLDPNDKKEGSSSLKCEGNGAVQFQKVFSTPVNSGVTKENGYFQFWYYVSDPNKLSVNNRVEISSSGTYEDFYGWILPTNLSAGWNFISLKISNADVYGESAPDSPPNLSAINYFRIFNYVTGSIITKIDDIRFTTPILDNCDSSTGWNSDHGTLSLDMTDEKEGSACVKSISDNIFISFWKTFSTPVNSGIIDPNTGYLQFWFYISDPNNLIGENQIEITSSGTGDEKEYNWSIPTNLSAGWNLISLKLSDAGISDPNNIAPNLSAINYFRIYTNLSSSITTKIDDIRFTRDNILKLDVAYYDREKHFVSRKFKDDVSAGDTYTFQSGDYIEYDIRLLSNVPGGGVDCYFTAKDKTFDPNKVNVTDDKITITSHNYSTGDPVKFSSTGSLPEGLYDWMTYYVKVDANSSSNLYLYDSSAHAAAQQKTFTSSAVDTSADTITINSHGCITEDAVRFINSGGTLPGGIDPNNTYYIRKIDTNKFKLYTVSTLAKEGGTPGLIDLTSGGTGTHIMRVGLIDITGGGTGTHSIWMENNLTAYTWVDQYGYSGGLNTDLRDPNCDADAQWYTRGLTIPSQAVGGKTKYWTLGIMDFDPNDAYKGVTLGVNNVRVYHSNGKMAFTAYVDGQPNDTSIVNGGTIGWPDWEGNCLSRLSTYDISGGLPIARPDPLKPSHSPQIITPSSPYNSAKDKIVADYNLSSYLTTDEKSNRVDVTDKIQDAMAYCFYNGGGTVYLPAGYYGIHDSLIIPPGVTLRGDWRDPDVGSDAYGTVLCVYSSDSPVLMMTDATLNGITIYYPHQTVPPSYRPYTIDIERLWGDCATVQNCTLLNSYNGIKTTARSVIDNVKGTCLKTGIYIGTSYDVEHIQRITLKNDYWAGVRDNDPNLCWGTSPSVSTIDNWTLANGTGVVNLDDDGLVISDVSVKNYKIGLHVTEMIPDSTTHAGVWTRAYQFSATYCNKALLVDQGADMMFANCTFKSSGGTEPIAVEITGYEINNVGIDDEGTLLFNSCTIGADGPNSRPINAVRMNGNNGISNFMANFQNCTFNDWSGNACIDAAGKGTVVVEGCDFGTARTIGSGNYGVKLSGVFESAVVLGNIFTGNGTYLVNDTTSPACNLQVDNPVPDNTYKFEKLTTSLGGDPNIPWNTADHKPQNDPNNRFYNVKSAQYNAPSVLPASSTEPNDATSSIQQALNDAGSAGGGIVYLPAGRYKVSGNLTVPANVELRGSYGGIHEFFAYGTTLSVFGSPSSSVAAADTDQAFITLAGNNAGVRGLSIFHPNLDSKNIIDPNSCWDPNFYTPYPFDIRGGDPNHQDPNGLYVIGVTHVNSYKGIDFSKYRCDNHFIKYDFGTCLHDTYKIGASIRGWVENVENLGNFYIGYEPPENLAFPAKSKEIAYGVGLTDPYARGYNFYQSLYKNAVWLIGDVANEYMISRWELNKCADIISMPDPNDPNKAPHAVLNGFTSGDGTAIASYYITGTAANGIISINDTGFMSPGYTYPGNNTMFVHIEKGVLKQFNADLWNDIGENVNNGFEILGGTYVLQGGQIRWKHIMEVGNSSGGTARVKVNGIWFDEPGVGTGTEDIRVLNCSQDPNTPSEFFGNIGNTNFLFYKAAGVGNISGGGNETGGKNILRSEP